MLRDIAIRTTHCVVPIACVFECSSAHIRHLLVRHTHVRKVRMFELEEASVQAIIGACVLIALCHRSYAMGYSSARLSDHSVGYASWLSFVASAEFRWIDALGVVPAAPVGQVGRWGP